MVSSTLYCDNCGAANRSQARFCISCGQAMPAAPSSTGLLALQSVLKGRYRVLSLLGQGGMGAVYKAEDRQLGDRVVAVKEMGQSGLSPQELVETAEAFKREALLLAKLFHRHLPRIYEHFAEGGRWYLVMDYIEGETLEDHLADAGGRLPVEEVLDLGTQLCSVLDYLHTRQPPIIFRDLKPANVMRTADGDVFLIDFGIARLFKPGQTKDTAAYGSAGYAAPEQYGKAQTTPQSDIYGLGATLHHLLSGNDPSQSPFRFAPLSGAGIPTGLGVLIARMVEMDTDKRPGSMAEVKQELQRLAAQPKQPEPSLVVSKQGGGQYTSISKAIKSAKAGARILVRPGTYSEGLVLDRPVEIVGDGPREQIILESSDADCILMQTDEATVQGVTLRCRAGLKNNRYFAVDIPGGQLLLKDCDITSDSLACVVVHGSMANPVIQGCRIHDGKQSGVFVWEQGQGALEECDIFGNAYAGVESRTGGNPFIQRCRINRNGYEAIWVHEKGRGTVENCDLTGNTRGAWDIGFGWHVRRSGNKE